MPCRAAATRHARPPTKGPVVVATADIPLSTRIRADQVTTKVIALTPSSPAPTRSLAGHRPDRPPAGRQRRADHHDHARRRRTGTIINVEVPAGLRAIAVKVDQISGVGTVIKTGDYVDMVIALSEEQFASVVRDPANPTRSSSPTRAPRARPSS